MKKLNLLVVFALFLMPAMAQQHTVKSPDAKLELTFFLENGKPVYKVNYNGVPMLENSPLGLVANIGDFSSGMKLIRNSESKIDKSYTQDRIKRSTIRYQANEAVFTLANKDDHRIDIIFRVSNNDIAFSYRLHSRQKIVNATIIKEATGYNFPIKTTTFLTPQATPMIGWERTKPSYEEDYVADEAMGTPSQYGIGYTFPGLFRIGGDGWVLLSETGVGGGYCGARLSEGTKDGLYRIAYPEPGENNGIGDASPSISLPGTTPWRTITVGDNLKPIVETTITYDVVDPLYEPSIDYRFGRGTWSWIMWQDDSMNWDDQITFINLAADMGYEYILVDANWHSNIGYERMPALINYAKSKNVDVFLWYNSNGYWNDAPLGPHNKMNNSIIRKREMKWMQSLGVKGIKVDFFGGDKQMTMQLYEDIMSDANDYGIMTVFHGCTLPRGWERMYPNFVGSEAVLASENLIFQQKYNDLEAFNASLHPFIRNSVAVMEFGPVLLNKRHNRNNDGGHTRRTSETFQLATAVLFQNPVQFFAIAPNNLTEMPAFIIDFMKDVPTTWDETVFIDGYPGKYVVLARRHGEKWYVTGINAQKEALSLNVKLPMFVGKFVDRYSDDEKLNPKKDCTLINSRGETRLTIQPNGAVILINQL